ACEHAHATFRHAVRRVAGHGPVFVHRGHVDDPTTAALRHHLLGRELRAEEGALEVDVQHLRELVFGRVENRGAGLDARIVDHDVDAAQFLHRNVYAVPQVFDFAHVGID